MSDYSDLLTILRDGGWRGAEAADAIEALQAEVGRLKHDIARHIRIATDLYFEVERLKGVLAEIADLEDNRSDEAAGTARRALEAKP